MSSFILSTFGMDGCSKGNHIWVCPYCGQENDYILDINNSNYVDSFTNKSDKYSLISVDVRCHFCKKLFKLDVKGLDNTLQVRDTYNCAINPVSAIKEYCINRPECKELMAKTGDHVFVKLLAKCSGGLNDADKHGCTMPVHEKCYRLEHLEAFVLKDRKQCKVRARSYVELINFIKVTLIMCTELKAPIKFDGDIPIIMPGSFNDSVWLISIKHTKGTNLVSLEQASIIENIDSINASEIFIYHQDDFKTFLTLYKGGECNADM